MHTAWAAQWLQYQRKQDEADAALAYADVASLGTTHEDENEDENKGNDEEAATAAAVMKDVATAAAAAGESSSSSGGGDDDVVVVVVPVFTGSNAMRGGRLSTPFNAPVVLPARLAAAAKVEVDFSLDCVNGTDAGCPAWDHVLQLHACCRGEQGEGGVHSHTTKELSASTRPLFHLSPPIADGINHPFASLKPQVERTRVHG